MPYDARAVANFFLDYGASKGQSVTTMSLLKILYFAHAWYLAKTGSPLVGQSFEAWQYGPVNRVVYEQFRKLGGRPIESRAQVLNAIKGRFEIASYHQISPEIRRFLRNVFDYYSQYHPFKLSDLTHEKGSPWEEVWMEATRRAVPGMLISNESIRDWFERSREAQRSAGDRGWTL
jgi:uncharacterized phage-associated protein